ncbi:MAG: substrate-binding domain-containing protein [Rhodospirillales bacterium]|nr:substrate-binding domain-containing protein [Rhodospirillales bacterium]
MRLRPFSVALLLASFAATSPATADELRVLSAGAFRKVVDAMAPIYQRQTGHKLAIDNGTVGQLSARIEKGEAFDLLIVSPEAVARLGEKGFVVAERMKPLARVGVGVMVRDGAAKPDIASVESFKAALLAAPTIAYIDPKSGGSSGVYIAGLLQRLGIAEAVAPKAKLKQGGYVADLLLKGEAELGLHQISEIVPVKGVTLVGPLPPAIQNYTVYAGAPSTKAGNAQAVQALLDLLAGPDVAAALAPMGMERAPPSP